MKPKIVSIFSGVGGIDFGFEKAGFETVFASDIWDRACESLKENFPSSDIVCDTIENVDFKKIKKNHKEIDGLVGGPPCPPFSIGDRHRPAHNAPPGWYPTRDIARLSCSDPE